MGFDVVAMRNGLHAIRDLDAGEIMHPGIGPLEEAELLYVRQSRLRERLEAGISSGTLTLFDVGLGAGSNAAAAWRAAQEAGPGAARLEIISFERDLGALELALTDAEAPHFGLTGDTAVAARAVLERGSHETPRACWRLIAGDLPQTLSMAPAKADMIFWDPYSPRTNSSLWTVSVFAMLRSLCADGCTLFTYSQATAAGTAMLLAGWSVGVGVAVGAKAHTTMSALQLADVTHPLDARWLDRLTRSSAPWPTDAPTGALELIRSSAQFR